MTRNDAAARRAQNVALQAGDIWATKERWLPCVAGARDLLGVTGLERPAGLSADGELALNHYMVAASGLVKWTLRYGWRGTWVVIGGFVTDYLPAEERRKPSKPVTTHGRVVTVTASKLRRQDSVNVRQVMVLVDATGLPVPVPPEVWNAMGL